MITRGQIRNALLLLTPNKEVFFQTHSKWEANEIEKILKQEIRRSDLPYSFNITRRFDPERLAYVIRVSCLPPATIYLKDEEGRISKLDWEGNEE